MNSETCECSKAELELLTVPPVNTSMERGRVEEFLPISSVGDTGPIEFHVASSTDEYLDIGRTQLYLRVKVVQKEDKGVLPDDAQVSTTNLWMHSLFSQVDVQLNGKLITPSTNTYPYKAYLEDLLSYGSDAKESQLGSEMWIPDKPNLAEFNPLADDVSNTGLKTRHGLIGRSKTVEMMGRLHCDIFMQDRYLTNGVNVHIKLIRKPEAFHLIGAEDKYLLQITDIALYVRKVKLNPMIPLMHNKALNSGKTLKYPIRRAVVSTFTIPNNTMSATKDNVIMGQLPRRVIVGLVKNSSFNGSIKMNPYNFETFNLNFLALFAGGQQFPAKPLTPNFTENQYMRSFMTMFEGTGMLNENRGHDITRENYPKGFTLYAFDLTSDMAEGSHVDPIKHGSLKVEVHFDRQLPSTVNVILYCEYDNLIQFDRARNVITDY